MNYESNRIRFEKKGSGLVEKGSINSKDNLLLLDNNIVKREILTPDDALKSEVVSPTIKKKMSEGELLPAVPHPTLKQSFKLNRTNTVLSGQNQEVDKEESKLKISIDKFLENNLYVIFMTLVTIYALFGTDISVAFLSQELDSTFDYVTTVAFLLFLIELVLSCYAKKDYIFSFFFWLDFVSTISLIMEIDFIFSPLLNQLG